MRKNEVGKLISTVCKKNCNIDLHITLLQKSHNGKIISFEDDRFLEFDDSSFGRLFIPYSKIIDIELMKLHHL